jgi:transposase
VQQQALRDFTRATAGFFAGTHGRPSWRKAGRDEGFRVTGRRKDWCEQTSTDLARRFDVIRVEDLKIRNMTRSAKGTPGSPGKNVRAKAGLNDGIQKSGWGLLVRRLEDKAPGRVERVPTAYTSQCCSACGHVARENRESQAVFRCAACWGGCQETSRWPERRIRRWRLRRVCLC